MKIRYEFSEYRMNKLTFYGTHGKTLCKVLLEERIYYHDRSDNQYYSCHGCGVLRDIALHSCKRRGRNILTVKQYFNTLLNIYKEQLQRFLVM